MRAGSSGLQPPHIPRMGDVPLNQKLAKIGDRKLGQMMGVDPPKSTEFPNAAAASKPPVVGKGQAAGKGQMIDVTG